MFGRKTTDIEKIINKLPSNIRLLESSYKNTQSYAIFIDDEYGEFQAKPHDVINRGRKHPKRNKKKGGGNAPQKYTVEQIEEKIKNILQIDIRIIHDSYKGVGENCQFVINGREFVSKPSRVLKGKLPREIYLKKLNEKNLMSLEDFKKKLSEIRDDVEVLEYNEDYKKKKSLFLFKNFTNPVRYLPISVLNGALHPSERAKLSLNAYFNRTGFQNPSQNPEIRKKIFQKQGMSLPEKKIFLFLKNRGFDFKYNSQLHEIGKFWDFIVFKNDKPKIIIEIDGEFVHGITQDANSGHINGVKDAQRFQNIDEEIIYLQCDSSRIEKLYDEILRVFDISYQEWVNEIVDHCSRIPFPYPSYDEKRMRKDYQNLCQQTVYKRNFYTGNSIMLNFHRSIYSSHRENQISPLEAWHDKEILKRCVKNRFIYSNNLSSVGIARGFEMNRIASRVSVFQPSLARMIIEKYARDCKTIIDPFSGFSGRMLGSASLLKTYYGYDCRKEAIEEANNIKDFLNLCDTNLDIKNIITDDYQGEYDLLLTCPPYENKEIWFQDQKNHHVDFYIDLCLQKIKAKKYIFIIDDIQTKYEKYHIEDVCNQSHFGKNKEKILLIGDKNEF